MSQVSRIAIGSQPPIVPLHSTTRLQLLGAFELHVDGRLVDLPNTSQRLIAFLALQGAMVRRHFVAGSLWLEVPDRRALASLRSALWRVHGSGSDLIVTAGSSLGLKESVRVDVVDAGASAAAVPHEGEARQDTALSPLVAELLPDWYDDWIVPKREVWRQVRLHAMETVARRLCGRADYSLALEFALAAIAVDPLRESAHRVAMEIHLAEGNASEAFRHYSRYGEYLERELGLHPSDAMQGLLPDA